MKTRKNRNPFFFSRAGFLLISITVAGAAALSLHWADGDTVVNRDATVQAVPYSTVVNTIANSGTAGAFTTVAGQVVATSHPANNFPGVAIKGLGFDVADKISVVNLDATKLGVANGTVITTIANPGDAGLFTTVAGTVVATSHPANNNPGVLIQGLGFNGGDKMTAAQFAPAVGLSGNQVHSVRAWVWNGALGTEETIVAWGRRGGGPNGSNCAFHQGLSADFGAVGHWGAQDVPYGTMNGTSIAATEGRWANLAYTFDGTTSRVYINGILSNVDAHGALSVHAESNPISLGAENENGNPATTPVSLDGTIARGQVFKTVKTAQEILDAYNAEAPLFFDGTDPNVPPVAVNDTVTMHANGKFRLNVVANDTGGIKRSTLRITSGPSHGSAVAHPDGTISYQHTTGTPASDAITYAVDNFTGTLTSSATVTINFTTNFRFAAGFATLPAGPPPTAYKLEEAFPGITFQGPHTADTVRGDTRKLFVAQDDGRVYLIPDVTQTPATSVLVLDIRSEVDSAALEKALKGIAIHPQLGEQRVHFPDL